MGGEGKIMNTSQGVMINKGRDKRVRQEKKKSNEKKVKEGVSEDKKQGK